MMGASLAHAIRKSMSINKLHGVVRTGKSAKYIEGHSIADKVFVHDNLSQIQDLDIDEYDLVVLGIPPGTITRLVPLIRNTTALITDMSSTRKVVHEAFAKRPELKFIGSHPMCGSENTGPAAGLPDLFVNNLCLIISDLHNNIDQIHRHLLYEFWHGFGMKTFEIDVADHDKVLAYLSHAPHIISSLLTHWASSSSSVKAATESSPIPITGGGFRSMTRIAGSNPQMWTDILNANKENILASLKQYHALLGELIEQYEKKPDSEWLAWHKESRILRNQLCDFNSD